MSFNIEFLTASTGAGILHSEGHGAPPWVSRPFQLISWWEMEKFRAEIFFGVGRALATINGMLGDGKVSSYDFGKERVAVIRDQLLPLMCEDCKGCGLVVSTELSKRWGDELKDETSHTFGEIAKKAEHLSETISIEMAQRLFMYIPAERAAYYDQREAFGPDVNTAFPSAIFDIIEAGNCYAAGRYTACVMHLSRVTEVALTVLAEKELGLPHRNNWGAHLSDVEKELEQRYKEAGARTQKEMFYAEATAQIGHIKTAWRNPTMHVDRTYTDEMAEDIMNAIKAFMRHMATKIHE